MIKELKYGEIAIKINKFMVENANIFGYNGL